ncbi:MAG: hypothetical protein QXF77_07640 [Candidatus Jordarchaeales archaeon]
MTWQIRLKAMTRYEAAKFVKALPLNIIFLLIACWVSSFLTQGITVSIDSKLSYLIQAFIIRETNPSSPIYSYFHYYLSQLDMAFEAFSFLPDPLRGYLALVFLFRGDIVQASFGIQFVFPMFLVSMVPFAMLRTSRIKGDEVYLFVRLDRSKLLVFRSIMNALLYSLLVTFLVHISKIYVINNNVSLYLFSPVIEWMTPSHSIILPVFIFLLFIQAIMALINIYSSRATFIVPLFLLITFMFQQLLLSSLISQVSPEVTGRTILSLLPSSSLQFPPQYQSQQQLLLMLIQLLMAREAISNFCLLPLGQLSVLIHAASSLMSGVWCLALFDPAQLLKEAMIVLPDSVLIGQDVGLLPQALQVLVVIESISKPLYDLSATLAYLLYPTAALLSFAAIIFGRKTV